MQITLNDTEIRNAIEEKVRKQINFSDSQHVDIELRAGRGENGMTATLSIGDMTVSPTTTTKVADDAEKRRPKPKMAVEVESRKEVEGPEEKKPLEESPPTEAGKKSLFEDE